MNCDGVRGLLSAYLDGELSPGELLRVEQHLRRCPSCADEVDSLRQTIALVASLDEVEVPATFHTQLHERLIALGPPAVQEPRRTAGTAWQRGMRRWVVPAAAAAAALAIGLTTFPQAGRLVQVGLEEPGGGFQSPEGIPASGDLARADAGLSPDSVVTGGKSGSTDPDPGETVRDPSGGEMTAAAGSTTGSAVASANQPGNAGGNVNIVGGSSGDAQAAATGSDAPVASPDLEPLYSHSITMTAAESNRQELLTALAAYEPREASDSILITVPSDDRDAVVAAIQAVPDLKLAAEPVETETDLALQIHDTAAQLEADRQHLAALQEQMPSLTEPSAQADARGLQQSLEARIAQNGAALDRLNGQVGRAFITVYLQAQGE